MVCMKLEPKPFFVTNKTEYVLKSVMYRGSLLHTVSVHADSKHAFIWKLQYSLPKSNFVV